MAAIDPELFRTHNDRLLRAVRRQVCAPDAVVEDACAFAWLQAVRLEPNRETMFAWLATVAIREGWRLAAREQRDARLEDLGCEAPALKSPRDAFAAAEAREALVTLASLPERQRRYLSLLIAGYAYRDIARLERTTYTNVNKHLARARATLRTVRSEAA